MRYWILLITIWLVGSSEVRAGELTNHPFQGLRYFKFSKILTSYSQPLGLRSFSDSPSTHSDSLHKNYSPRRAAIYSFLIPGWGQYYSGHKRKAAGFFGIEILSWTIYGILKKQGDDKDTKFRRYADTYWDKRNYANYLIWLSGNPAIMVNNIIDWDALNAAESLYPNFTHHLPRTNTQQYYEMIGKYDQFVYGWDDTGTNYIPHDQVSNVLSSRRLFYEDLRYDSNQLLGRARWATAIVMTNHILSSLDAAITIQRGKNHLVHTELRMEQKIFSNRYETCAVFRLRW